MVVEPGRSPIWGTLTDRQLEVLKLVAEGVSTREIAKRLHMSVWTVQTHHRDMQARLGARTQAQAVHVAHRLGLLG